jgi:choline dehydrogenase-like flavoprotein
MDSESNVVIIGSGVTGSLVANLLLNAGVRNIVMLEAGQSITMQDPRSWFDFVTTGRTPYQSLYDTTQDYEAAGANPWQITGSRVLGRGGSTIHWGGWCPRFMPEDFELKSRTGLGIDWPYDYATLEPFYCQAEAYLGVAGVETAGQRDWRSAPYPMVGATLPLTASPIVDALTGLGYSFTHMPVARNTVAYNGQSQCITTGTCNYCPVGARFTGDQPLGKLAARNGFTLLLNAPVTRIVMSAKDTAAAIEYCPVGEGGATHTLSANAVFVCNGAFEAPKLLLGSTSRYWVGGIGNDNDLVGRYLVANPYLYCRGGASSNPQRLQQELNFPNLATRQWDTEEEQAQGKFLMNMSYDAPLLQPASLMYQGKTAAEIQSAVTGPFQYELQGAVSPLPDYNNRISLASGTTRFGLPRTSIFTPEPLVPAATIALNVQRMTELYAKMGFTVSGGGAYPQRGDHAASTCRMGASDSDGVVDAQMRVFGTENLFVTCNAAVPTLGAANLTLTTLAAITKAVTEVLASKPVWAGQ